MYWIFSQNSQKNTCVRVSGLCMFLWLFIKCLWEPYLQTASGEWFLRFHLRKIIILTLCKYYFYLNTIYSNTDASLFLFTCFRKTQTKAHIRRTRASKTLSYIYTNDFILLFPEILVITHRKYVSSTFLLKAELRPTFQFWFRRSC